MTNYGYTDYLLSKDYLCRMLRVCTYLLLFIITTVLMSCSQNSENKKIESSSNRITSRVNYQQSLINNYNQLESLVDTNTKTDFIYSSNISKNVGEIVNLNMGELEPRNEHIKINEPKFQTSNCTKELEISKSTRLLRVVFDNDIFNNTDYYYTNGVNIELINPIAEHSPLSRILLGLKNTELDLYGFSIMQNIYTPTNPDIEEISVGDRPFSAFLTIGQFRESYNLNRNLSIKSSLNFGVLGPASMGGVVQSSIHNIEPVGWNNQIKNNVVIDYSINIEKGIISTPHYELNLTAGGNIGTIFNKINGGFYTRIGNFTPVVKGNFLNSNQKNNKLQFWFFITGNTNFVLYDATLQGGLTGNTNSYTINSNDISRTVINLSVGVAAYYRNAGMEIQNFYISPEFKNAYDFRWGRIKLIFKI